MVVSGDRRPYVLLRVPAGRDDLLAHAREAAPDGVAIDLEAGHSPPVTGVLNDWRQAEIAPEVWVRLPSLRANGIEAILDAAMAWSPHGLILAGAVGRIDIEQLGTKLSVREAERDLPDGALRIIVMAADSAQGVLRLSSLATDISPRLAGIGIDHRRLAAELGCAPGAPAIAYAAALTVVTAAAAGVPALLTLDEPSVDAAVALSALWRDGFGGTIAHDPGTVALARASPGPT